MILKTSHRLHDSATLAAVTDSNNKVADSTAVRLYSTWPLPANYGFENMVDKSANCKLNTTSSEKVRKKLIDAPPKKYVFSKRTYEDTIDELCFADLSDMSEFSEEQKKWKTLERKMSEEKKTWLLQIYSQFYAQCVPVDTRDEGIHYLHWVVRKPSKTFSSH